MLSLMKSEAELEKKGNVCVGPSVDVELVEDENRQATPRRSRVGAKAPILGDHMLSKAQRIRNRKSTSR